MAGNYADSRDFQFFAKEQTGFLTPVHPVPADAFRGKLNVKRSQTNSTYTEIRNTRSRGASIRGKVSGEWIASGMYVPSGTAGTPSDIGLFIKQCLGKQAIGGTVVYTLEKQPETTLFGLSLLSNPGIYESFAYGALVNEFGLTFSGEGEVGYSASGPCVDVAIAGETTLASTAGAAATSIVVTTGDGRKFSKYGKIDIGTETGFVISSNPTGDTIIFAPPLTGSQAAGLVVKPHVINGSTLGAPIHGVDVSITLDGSTASINGGEIKCMNNYALRNSEIGSEIGSGFTAGVRDVSFSLSFFLTKDQFKYYGDAYFNNTRDLQVNIGTVAGRTTVIDMNKIEFTDTPEITVPDDGEVEVTMEGFALPTVTDDELTITEQ